MGKNFDRSSIRAGILAILLSFSASLAPETSFSQSDEGSAFEPGASACRDSHWCSSAEEDLQNIESAGFRLVRIQREIEDVANILGESEEQNRRYGKGITRPSLNGILDKGRMPSSNPKGKFLLNDIDSLEQRLFLAFEEKRRLTEYLRESGRAFHRNVFELSQEIENISNYDDPAVQKLLRDYMDALVRNYNSLIVSDLFRNLDCPGPGCPLDPFLTSNQLIG